jgi:preprotein translocase SecE subunit
MIKPINIVLRTKNNRVRMVAVNKVENFLKESYGELKKIQFPSKKETLKLTGYVVGVSLVSGLLISLFDYVFKELLTIIITK